MQRKTIISVILDESGSMLPKRTDTIDGYNSFLEEQKKILEDEARLILVKFNSEVKVIHDCIDLKKVPEMDKETYKPGGQTALYDAVSKGINIVKKEKKSNERVICVIMTDGEENCSRETTKEGIQSEISWWASKDDWSFIYIGENPDRWSSETSMSRSHSIPFCHHNPRKNFRYASSACSSLRTSYSCSLNELKYQFNSF